MRLLIFLSLVSLSCDVSSRTSIPCSLQPVFTSHSLLKFPLPPQAPLPPALSTPVNSHIPPPLPLQTNKHSYPLMHTLDKALTSSHFPCTRTSVTQYMPVGVCVRTHTHTHTHHTHSYTPVHKTYQLEDLRNVYYMHTNTHTHTQ